MCALAFVVAIAPTSSFSGLFFSPFAIARKHSLLALVSNVIVPLSSLIHSIMNSFHSFLYFPPRPH